jgi:hypothetical protein
MDGISAYVDRRVHVLIQVEGLLEIAVAAGAIRQRPVIQSIHMLFRCVPVDKASLASIACVSIPVA